LFKRKEVDVAAERKEKNRGEKARGKRKNARNEATGLNKGKSLRKSMRRYHADHGHRAQNFAGKRIQKGKKEKKE